MTEKMKLAGLCIFGQAEKSRLAKAKALLREELQPPGSKDGWWVYTQLCGEAQNGKPGLTLHRV
jgi:hypothetical protein